MRLRRPLLVLPILLSLLLVGCSSGSTKAAAPEGLPTVSGSYGDKPTFTFPSGEAPTSVQSIVLHPGTGDVVKKGDLLVADYLGQVLRGAVFDNSYDRKTPSGFVIGTGKVIPAWDQVLVGAKVGSRVLMSVPPSGGYGDSGNAGAGIKGTDTLVFVVDLIATYGSTVSGDPEATPQQGAPAGIVVSGAFGAVPTLTVSKTTAPPKAPSLTLLAKGSGAPVTEGLLVLQFVASRYTGEPAGSSYATAPAAFPLGGQAAAENPFEKVRGVPLGSRVLLQVPGVAGQPPLAIVVDLIAQPKTAAQTA